MTAPPPSHSAGKASRRIRLLAFLRFGDERIEIRTLHRGALRIGGRRGLTLPEGSLPDGHVLFRVRNGEALLRIAGALTGVARLRGERRELASAGADDRKGGQQIALRPGDLGLVLDPAWNGAMIEFVCERWTAPATARFRPDWRIAMGLMISAAVHGGIVAVVLGAGPKPRTHRVQTPPRRLASLIEALKPEPPPKVGDERQSDEAASGRRDRASGRNLASKRVRAKGVLAALRQFGAKGSSRGSLGAVFSQNDNSAADANPSLGALAAAIGDGAGLGVSATGTGTGGGGLGTQGGALLRASGGPSLGQRRARGIGGTVSKVPARSVRVEGGLDRAEVLKVINQHMGAVRNCYERALLARPDVEGKLSIEWVVGPGGAVTSARVASSTMRDVGVANCILSDLRRWAFPKPSGGRAVTVVFPFIFNASGY